jgi:TPR repeat protein
MKTAIEKWTVAANQGHPYAVHNLFQAFRMGGGAVKDPKKALELCHKAAGRGLADAQCDIGVHYYGGDTEGAARDINKALE